MGIKVPSLEGVLQALPYSMLSIPMPALMRRGSKVKAPKPPQESAAPGPPPAGFGLLAFEATNADGLDKHYDEEPGGRLGKGHFASVIKARSHATGQIVAVKAIFKERMAKHGSEASSRVQTEAAIMRRLDHPNIIKLHETFEDDAHWYLVLDLCVGGELFDQIVKASHFSERTAARLVKQILSALHHLHAMSVAYCDLKPDNLLLVDDTPIEQGTLKLVDFGIAQ